MMSCTPAIQNILSYHNNNIQIFKNKESELIPEHKSFLLRKKCCTHESFLYLAQQPPVGQGLLI